MCKLNIINNLFFKLKNKNLVLLPYKNKNVNKHINTKEGLLKLISGSFWVLSV